MYLIKRDLRRLQPSKERTNKLLKNANQITNELLKSTVDPISRGEQEKKSKKCQILYVKHYYRRCLLDLFSNNVDLQL